MQKVIRDGKLETEFTQTVSVFLKEKMLSCDIVRGKTSTFMLMPVHMHHSENLTETRTQNSATSDNTFAINNSFFEVNGISQVLPLRWLYIACTLLLAFGDCCCMQVIFEDCVFPAVHL